MSVTPKVPTPREMLQRHLIEVVGTALHEFSPPQLMLVLPASEGGHLPEWLQRLRNDEKFKHAVTTMVSGIAIVINDRLAAAERAGEHAGSMWCERWHGSGGAEGREGWSILAGRDVVAYLGRDVESDAVTEIVAAHNKGVMTERPVGASPSADPIQHVPV